MSIKTMNETFEARLYHMGYVLPDVRALVRNQFYLTGLSFLVAVATGWMLPFVWDFCAGAVLMTLNFSSLAKFVQHLIHRQKGAVVQLLVSFYGRLLLTGLALYALIAWGNANVVSLLAGLSTVVVTILIWGAAQVIGKNAKEA
ncbi:ATP synthase subunit I [Desulfobaculum bizertense]|uniref:ATP synthase subunit I n=1 Tax=Desulfobaculum bizertense TaxID=376490 RepID=UPI001F1F81AC|nr:ATP synthase subunit I [Desulfobaculum bizertense]UIJ37282.1 ATP synthase subunit I [Desulfobaculum bizertense]